MDTVTLSKQINTALTNDDIVSAVFCLIHAAYQIYYYHYATIEKNMLTRWGTEFKLLITRTYFTQARLN